MTKYIIRTMMLVMLVTFFPFVVDQFGFGKMWIAVGAGVVGMIAWGIEWLIKGGGKIKVSGVLGVVTLMTVWAVVCWVRLAAGAQTRGWWGVSGLAFWLCWWMWGWLWHQTEEEKDNGFRWLSAAGVLAVVSSLMIFLVPTAKLPLVWPKEEPIISLGANWSLIGSLVAEAVLVAVLLSYWLRRLIIGMKERANLVFVGDLVMTMVMTLGLFLDVYRIVKAGWGGLDLGTSWAIAVEAFKRSPIFGVGTGNFVTAFNVLRPTSFNLTKFWASSFGNSGVAGLQIWTELGVVGLGLGLWLINRIWGLRKLSVEYGRVIIVTLVAVLLPANFWIWWLWLWLVSKEVKKKEIGLVLKVGERGFNIAPIMLVVVMLGMAGWGAVRWTKTLRGEMYLRDSLVAMSRNDGGGAYNLGIKAITANPTNAEYRRIYSQTNLALAVDLLQNKDISEEEKQKASVLIQQAVNEAKTAISLDNINATYWSNLAGIYRQVAPVIQGAADWSFQAYQQAVALEPASALLKLDMGSLLFAAGRYEEADRVFEEVVKAKQDYANGWYNWAYTAKNLNKLPEAVQRLAQALALVPTNSEDYDKATKELDVWKKELEELTAKQKEQQKVQEQQSKLPAEESLKTAEPLPTITKEKEVTVPEGIEPPVSVTPTPIN